MIIDLIILACLAAVAYLNWKILTDLEDLEEVVAALLIELGQKGVITLGNNDAT